MKKVKRLFQLPDVLTPYPARDWSLGLIIFALVLVGFVGYALYVSVGLNSGIFVSNGNEVPSSVEPFDRSEIDALKAIYDARKINYEAPPSSINLPDPR
ncbi:hypothetical protein EPO56_02570 [Patescibacteria group bacterium]|nr:MAG: hypothetical protein EPO56_02570 [Patescibacteria group bacterium]